MNDVTIIDRFLDTFSRYIDSGFGLLHGEVAFLTATLIVIDMTLAGLFWAMSHATGQGEDVIAKLIRKVLYVGAFAYIIGNFNWLAGIVFRSFAGLGLTATGSAITMENFLQPGRLAKTGIDAGAPILEQIGEMAGFPEVFANLDPIVVMFLAWLVVVLCFFVLAIQLFITLIEFKLTTLAGFVLVPFALWNKTAFLAEKVLGNVVASGVRPGSLDQHISQERPNDIAALLDRFPGIGVVCCNGTASHKYLKRYFPELFLRETLSVIQMPSTSPAAARLTYEQKFRAYEEIMAPLLRKEREK